MNANLPRHRMDWRRRLAIALTRRIARCRPVRLPGLHRWVDHGPGLCRPVPQQLARRIAAEHPEPAIRTEQ